MNFRTCPHLMRAGFLLRDYMVKYEGCVSYGEVNV